MNKQVQIKDASQLPQPHIHHIHQLNGKVDMKSKLRTHNHCQNQNQNQNQGKRCSKPVPAFEKRSHSLIRRNSKLQQSYKERNEQLQDKILCPFPPDPHLRVHPAKKDINAQKFNSLKIELPISDYHNDSNLNDKEKNTLKYPKQRVSATNCPRRKAQVSQSQSPNHRNNKYARSFFQK